jgi:hypothetical protein
MEQPAITITYPTTLASLDDVELLTINISDAMRIVGILNGIVLNLKVWHGGCVIEQSINIQPLAIQNTPSDLSLGGGRGVGHTQNRG